MPRARLDGTPPPIPAPNSVPTPKIKGKARPAVVSRATCARMMQVSPAAITQACRPGKPLYAARSGHGIDITHEAVVRMLASKAAQRQQLQEQLDGVTGPVEPEPVPAPVAPKPLTPESAPFEPVEEPVTEPEPVEAAQSAAELERDIGPWRAQIDLASLIEPLGTLTETYGDAPELSRWIQARKHLAAAMREEMLLARTAGRLIPRTTVERMLQSIDTAFRLILTDAPRSIATRIAPTNMAPTAAIIRDSLEQILESGRSQMLEALTGDDVMAPLTEATALDDEVAAE